MNLHPSGVHVRVPEEEKTRYCCAVSLLGLLDTDFPTPARSFAMPLLHEAHTPGEPRPKKPPAPRFPRGNETKWDIIWHCSLVPCGSVFLWWTLLVGFQGKPTGKPVCRLVFFLGGDPIPKDDALIILQLCIRKHAAWPCLQKSQNPSRRP